MSNSAAGISLEMLMRYAQALEQHAGLALVFALASVVASNPSVRSRVVQSRVVLSGWVGPAVLVSVVAGGVAWGWHLAWLGDDAFISFRYADHLANGNGLVFNPGERVEGYTNFLWTLILAGFAAVGADLGQVAMVLSLACFAGLIALVPRLLRHGRPEAPVAFVSVAALATAAQYTLASYSTSGLETMFATLLAAVAVERALCRAPLAAGAAGIAATLAHPDHGILYAALGLAILLDSDRRRGLHRYALPFVLVYVPYFAWRWNYYGEFFPNTYYAKSAGLAYFEQGWVYAASFAIGSGLWLAAPLVAFGLWRTRHTLLGRYLLVAVPLFVLYVAKIGGDFMYGRLFCPLVAPLLVVAEVGWRELMREGRPALAAAGLAAFAMVAVPTVIFEAGEKKWHISDERTFYPVESFAPLVVRSRYFRSARGLNEYFAESGVAPRLGLQCVGTVGYYTGFPIVDALGITDRTVAHRPLEKRGRPGHEKLAPPGYLLARGVDLSDQPLYPEPYAALSRLRLGRFDYYLARYNAELLKPLRGQSDVEFIDFSEYIDGYLASPTASRSDEVDACDAWFFDAYYFSQSPGLPESSRRAVLTRRLLEAGRPALRPGEEWGALPEDFERTHRVDPSTAIRFEASGEDAARFAPRVRAGQGGQGGSAYTEHGGRFGRALSTRLNVSERGGIPGVQGTAHLRSTPFEIKGDVMELWVGGGRAGSALSISLWIDGVRRFTATGCGSELLGRRLWVIAPYKGQTAVLDLVDDRPGSRGHLLVDEIVQWVRSD